MARTITRIALALALSLSLGLAACQGPPDAPAPRTLEELDRALQRDPDDPEISIRIGELELAAGNTADAYVAFRRAAALSPDDVRAVSGLALAADALGFDDEARAAYARWEALEVGTSDATLQGSGRETRP
jgi:Flp pilus assembly protein TadD